MNDDNLCTQTAEEMAAIFAQSRDDEGCETDVPDINVGKPDKHTADVLPKNCGLEEKSLDNTGEILTAQTQPQKKFEFSKIVFLILFLITVGVTLFAMLIMWKTDSVAPLAYLIPSTYTAFATGTGFYFDKSKKENLIKLRSTYGNDMMDRVKGDA